MISLNSKREKYSIFSISFITQLHQSTLTMTTHTCASPVGQCDRILINVIAQFTPPFTAGLVTSPFC